MHEKRLLERIRDYEQDEIRRWETDPVALKESVLGYLRRILNTKKGSALITDDFGMPDFTDFPSSFASDIVRTLQDDIASMVQKYEPRLKDIRIDFIQQTDDILSLRFQIHGRFDTESLKTPVVFETVVQSDGRVTLSS